jgi:hypothetical protein
MPCENGKAWCKGPYGDGPGAICLPCDKKRTGATFSPPPVNLQTKSPVTPPTLKPVTPVVQSPPTPTADSPFRVALRKTKPVAAPKTKRTKGDTITKDYVPAEFELTAYRGDSRDPDVIFKDGFKTWVSAIFSVEDAREYLEYYVGLKTLDELSFKNHVNNGAIDILKPEGSSRPGPGDLMRNIIAARNKKRPTISTDTDAACGGYSEEGFIYRIQIPKMKKVDWKMAFGPNGSKINFKSGWPDLFLDNALIAEATCIAIFNRVSNVTTELSFFTDISPELIVQAYVVKDVG